MTEIPGPPPEAVLVRIARKAARVTTSAAAKHAGISVARLSQIEAGRERRLGEWRPVRAKDGTLAALASVVGVTPERLEQAGRPDAAAVLREMQASGSAPGPLTRREADPVPALVRDHWQDKTVRTLWGLDHLSEKSRLGRIIYHIEELEREAGNSSDSRSRPAGSSSP